MAQAGHADPAPALLHALGPFSQGPGADFGRRCRPGGVPLGVAKDRSRPSRTPPATRSTPRPEDPHNGVQ
eukprot:6198889-Alexandrium_andersonii.AAC.1